METFRHINGGGTIRGVDGAISSDSLLDKDSYIEGRTFVSHGSEVTKSAIKDSTVSLGDIRESVLVRSHVSNSLVYASALEGAVVRGTKDRATVVQNCLLSDRVVVEGATIRNIDITGPFLIHTDWNHTPRHHLLRPCEGVEMGIIECAPGYAHVGCLLPDTLVSGEFSRGFKTLYRGQVIEIETGSGARLCVTPNHPILTAQGFAPASEIKQGQELFLDMSAINRVSLRQKNVDYRPPTAQQAFEALKMISLVQPTRLTSDDFHGDGHFCEGEVEIVTPDRPLAFKLSTDLSEQAGNEDLTRDDTDLLGVSSSGRLFPISFRFFSTPLGVPRFLAGFNDKASVPSLTFLPVPIGLNRYRGAAQRDTLCFEPVPQRGAGNLVLSGQCLQVDAAEVLFDQARQAGQVRTQRPKSGISFAAPSYDYSRFAEQPNKHFSTDPRLNNKIAYRLSGRVFTDQVVKVWERSYFDHVYNFESPFGYMIANGVVVSNCKCRPIEEWIRKKETLRKIFVKRGWDSVSIDIIHQLFEEWRRVQLAIAS